MIVAISGKINSSKDLIGKIIQYLTDCKAFGYSHPIAEKDFNDWLNNNHFIESNWEIRRFADKLKDIVCLLIGCTREQLEDREFKEKELGEEWSIFEVYLDMKSLGEKKIENKTFLTRKEAEDYCFNYDSSYSRFNYKEVKLTPRKLLQTIGTDLFRNQLHKNVHINALFVDYIKREKNKYWVVGHGTDCDGYNNGTIIGFVHEGQAQFYCNESNQWSDGIQYSVVDNIDEAQEYCDQYITIINDNVRGPQVPIYSNVENDWIITDCRFPNEAQAIKDRGGIIIRVNRDLSCSVCKMTKAQRRGNICKEITCPSGRPKHESEVALDNYNGFDYVVENNSTIEDLIEKVKEILKQEKII